jgi:hypothetical protein
MKRTPEVGDIVRIGKDKRAVKVLLVFPASGYVRVGDGKNDITIHKNKIFKF